MIMAEFMSPSVFRTLNITLVCCVLLQVICHQEQPSSPDAVLKNFARPSSVLSSQADLFGPYQDEPTTDFFRAEDIAELDRFEDDLFSTSIEPPLTEFPAAGSPAPASSSSSSSAWLKQAQGGLKTGTTIVGAVYKDGVVLGADTRSTGGSMVANKQALKVHDLGAGLWACGAGTSADISRTTARAASHLAQLRHLSGGG
eukprot:CAMPEP_0113940332 /NCGR_PEP_ID=MMETSP1339-20121228/6489_1 /TAXON_ID=94617 /ORGANISM="Fibrocapsa japonica" /LENGTH=199 /DNA_ID=CAMNT_0000944131 /DNA_START=47 /DNA_END=643 /DNA_ORIENTATION=- /assembly_acc=CAM_ASM_000762